MANLTALAAARRVTLDERSDDAVVYFSDQTHNSIGKALRVLGFAREQIRALPSDEEFRLPVESLRRAVPKTAPTASGLSASSPTPARPTPARLILSINSPIFASGRICGCTSTELTERRPA